MLWKCLDSRREVEEEGHDWPAVSSGRKRRGKEGCRLRVTTIVEEEDEEPHRGRIEEEPPPPL
jgi:hypothetical protein